jgi:hypothetical protein
MDRFCLCGCGEVLTGRQTKFFSDACRMRYNRQRSKANAGRSVSFVSVRVSRQIEVKLSVVVVIETFGSDPLLDGFYLNRPTMYVLERHITAFLAEKYPGVKILAVKVDRNGQKR